MYRHQNRPTVITWKQFANKGYSAFASLHRQVRIGVLSVATLGVAAAAQAQRQSSPIVTVEEEKIIDEEELAEVTVSGTMAPLTQLQSARIVSVLSRQDIEQAAVQSINDLFKLVTGVDVRQRGGFGIQTDISIDGGTFDQVTLLLNGIDISNPQTGHLSADFPVSISDIERIEVLAFMAGKALAEPSISSRSMSLEGTSNLLLKAVPSAQEKARLVSLSRQARFRTASAVVEAEAMAAPSTVLGERGNSSIKATLKTRLCVLIGSSASRRKATEPTPSTAPIILTNMNGINDL